MDRSPPQKSNTFYSSFRLSALFVVCYPLAPLRPYVASHFWLIRNLLVSIGFEVSLSRADVQLTQRIMTRERQNSRRRELRDRAAALRFSRLRCIAMIYVRYFYDLCHLVRLLEGVRNLAEVLSLEEVEEGLSVVESTNEMLLGRVDLSGSDGRGDDLVKVADRVLEDNEAGW